MIYSKAYLRQKASAKFRKIDWQLTYEEWIQWWGNDITLRGKGKGKLCMARIGDVGAYSLANIYKSLYEDNIKIAHEGKKKGPQPKALVMARNLAVSIALTGRKQKRQTCPHCNLVGGNTMKRYHFDHCKEKSV